MQLFHYSIVSRLINPSAEAVSMKIAYLLSDSLVITKGFDLIIIMRREYNRRFDRDTRTRITFLASHAKKADAETAADIDLLIKTYKRLSTMKNRGAREFANLRTVEQAIATFYHEAIDQACNVFETHGLHHLDNLPNDEGLAFYTTPISGDAEAPVDDEVATSRVLQLYGDGGAIPDDDVTFILQPEALTPPFRPAPIPGPDAPEAWLGDAIWMEELVSLPFINQLTVTELYSIRRDLAVPGKAFRSAFDQWLKGAREESMSPEERRNWYKEQVQPAMAPFREAIAAQPLLHALRRASNDGDFITVWVGEMPLSAIWKFYKETENLKESTAAVLGSEDGRKRGRLRVPVILLSLIHANDAAEDGSGNGAGLERNMDAVPVSVRKTIQAD